MKESQGQQSVFLYEINMLIIFIFLFNLFLHSKQLKSIKYNAKVTTNSITVTFSSLSTNLQYTFILSSQILNHYFKCFEDL